MPPRRSHEPLAPISANIVTSRTARKIIHASGAENAMDYRIQEDLTIQSQQSQLSGLSSLEDQTTDDFGKLMIQHARDEQRLQDALQGNVRPFSKARPRQRGKLTLADLERNMRETENSFEQRRKERETSFLSFSSPPGSEGSVGSRESEPSLNIPRAWGRKAKTGTDWLRRSLDRYDDADEEDVIVKRTTAYTGDGTPRAIDWANAASDVPLPTTEDSPSVLRYMRGTPPSIQRRDEAAARAQQWNIDEDFTSTSIIASTPAFPRNTRIDDIRRRELETLTEVSVSDKTRDQSPEPASSPVERSVSRSAERKRQRTGQQQTSSSWTHPAEQPLHAPKGEPLGSLLVKSPSPAARSQSQQDGSSPIVVYKSTETPEELRQRPPPHRRADSHDLLRRLARAASGSPSPGRAAMEPESKQQSLRSDAPVISSKDASAVDTRPFSTTENEVVESSTAPSKPTGTAAAVDTEAVDPVTPMPDELTNEIQGQLARHAKTPVVTGAWIDTPAPATTRRLSLSPRETRFSPQKNRSSPAKSVGHRHGLPTPEASTSPKPPPQLQKPSLPESALAAVLGEAKIRPTPDDADLPYGRELNGIGESTINSLQDLIDDSTVATSADNTITLDLPDLPPLGTKPRTAAERQRWKEIEQVQRMNKQLRDVKHHVRDTRLGLRNLGNQMLSSDGEQQQQQQHAYGGSPSGCDTCGCPGGARSLLSPQHITSTIRNAFVVPQTPAISPRASSSSRRKYLWPFRWRPTTLGFILLSLLLYSLTEATLCAQYCQPRYAHRMSGYGVNPNAPRLPFVTPTLLTRPLYPVLRPLAKSIRTNGVEALRAYGLIGEEAKETYPWMKERPTLSPSESHAWDSMIAAAKRTAAPDVTRWAQRVVTALEQPASTAVRWVQSAATAGWGEDAEALGMGMDEVL